MSERKPTRARVAMCGCGAEMRLPKGRKVYKCTECENATYSPYYGYYPLDIAGVVTEMQHYRERTGDPYRWELLDSWMAKLEGKS